MGNIIFKYARYGFYYNPVTKIITLEKLPVKTFYKLKIDLLINKIEYKDIIVGV